MGGDLRLVDHAGEHFIISTHAPAWGATRYQSTTGRRCCDFYSRPRVGGDANEPTNQANAKAISTHAPAWGATGNTGILHDVSGISTHAPAWGATVLVDCDGQANLFLLTPQNRGRTHRRGTPQAETGV